MGTLYERPTQYTTLYERVDELIRSHKGQELLLHTTTRTAAIAELIGRSEGLEKTIREIAREIQELAAGLASKPARAGERLPSPPFAHLLRISDDAGVF